MFTPDIIILALGYVMMLLTGVLQKEKRDRYAIAFLVLAIAQALYIAAYLSFEIRFDVLSYTLGVCIWMHHYLIHKDDDFSQEYTLFTFQLNDISNHETWIVACITAGVTWFFATV